MRLLGYLVSPIFYALATVITLGKIIDNYLHSPDCKGCREDR